MAYTFIIPLGPDYSSEDSANWTLYCCEPSGADVDTTGWSWVHRWGGVFIVTVPNLVAGGGTYYITKGVPITAWKQGIVSSAVGGGAGLTAQETRDAMLLDPTGWSGNVGEGGVDALISAESRQTRRVVAGMTMTGRVTVGALGVTVAAVGLTAFTGEIEISGNTSMDDEVLVPLGVWSVANGWVPADPVPEGVYATIFFSAPTGVPTGEEVTLRFTANGDPPYSFTVHIPEGFLWGVPRGDGGGFVRPSPLHDPTRMIGCYPVDRGGDAEEQGRITREVIAGFGLYGGFNIPLLGCAVSGLNEAAITYMGTVDVSARASYGASLTPLGSWSKANGWIPVDPVPEGGYVSLVFSVDAAVPAGQAFSLTFAINSDPAKSIQIFIPEGFEWGAVRGDGMGFVQGDRYLHGGGAIGTTPAPVVPTATITQFVNQGLPMQIATAVRDVSNAAPPVGSLGADVKAGGGATGSGSVLYTWAEYEAGHNNDPDYGVPDVTVVVYSNNLATGTPVAKGVTDEVGTVDFYLNPGTYYLWRRKAGRKFTNPVTIEVNFGGNTDSEPENPAEIAFTWTEYETGHVGNPAYVIPDVWIRVYTNATGRGTPEAYGTTGAGGSVTFYLPAATYYLFRYKSGRVFNNPYTIEVS